MLSKLKQSWFKKIVHANKINVFLNKKVNKTRSLIMQIIHIKGLFNEIENIKL